MKILVTGATGFVGKHLVPELLEKGYSVRCLVRKSANVNRLKAMANVELWEGDVTDAKSLEGIGEGIDFVIHMAATGHVSAVSEEAFQWFVSINEGGTQNLVRELQRSGKIRKFVHFSSTAAMGPALHPILDENSKPNPVTPYQKSKYRSEQIVTNAFAQTGFPGVVVRPCMIYGPQGTGEFHKFCRLMKKGVFPKVGLGKNLTPLVHVRDVVQGAILAMEKGKPGNVYLLTSDSSIPMDELHHEIMSALGCKAPYLYVPAWMALGGAKAVEIAFSLVHKEPIVTGRNIKSTITDRTFDIAKARSELGYSPKISFHDGIKETIAWYRKENLL